MRRKIGIIGHGHVGGALKRGWDRAGHEVRTVGRDPDQVKNIGAWADIVVLAVPFGALDATLKELDGTIEGKPLVDVTNAIGPDRQLALGFSTSGAEELQKKARGARVVKAFHTQFARHMDKGRLGDAPLTAFAAADDPTAKAVVLELGKDLGFDMVDAGPLRNARLLEPLGMLNIQLGYALGLGPNIGFRLLRS